jgi:hypothetical protein
MAAGRDALQPFEIVFIAAVPSIAASVFAVFARAKGECQARKQSIFAISSATHTQ